MTATDTRPGSAAPARQPSGRRTASPRPRRFRRIGRHWHYAVLIGAVVVSVFPFYWMIVVASNTNEVISQIPPRLIPGPNLLENATNAVARVPFGGALLNSFVIAATTTVSTVVFATLAGFAFAKIQFRGRSALMAFVIATMMVPLQQLGLIPLYILMSRFGWVSSLRAVIVPGLVTGFGVFWMRQVVATSVHDELLEAGRIDGCSTFGLFRNVVVPSVRPGAAVLALYTFLFAWNDFLWPLIVLQDESKHTIQIALRTLNDTYYVDYAMVMTGTLLSVLPLIVVFVLLSRQMVAGLMEGAVKG
ncbi:carbohydrate ABC transporter permease [Nitriliruptor alkaliphilus]|uniref:carbohydrate ABC transporter permease n=1 Tax=Nitriliruptor alkaliphilus TaxID=427918 RepID=UPI0009FA4282|nr:carbohydrate ABC transporter permease [Nitriliruptor alkaliphilus]